MLLATYSYYPTGSVKTVNMGNSLTLTYTYHISGAVKTAKVETANGGELYSEMLHYEDCGDNECEPQYNGNISYMVQRISHDNRNFVQNRDVAYYYDQLNRLIKTDDLSQDYFDDIFEYDAQGRITAQRRAERADSAYGGEYAYKSGTNQLVSVAEGVGGTVDGRNMAAADNFVYDSEGNLIEDKSKRLKISYDWRGMPIEFTQYPPQENTGVSGDTLFRLTVAYDGTGRRISKTRWVKARGDAGWSRGHVTHYTGIGTEVRENFAGESPETKVVVNMPEGLGRYGIEDADHVAENGSAQTFEWYLKNHLGSTMLVYGTGGTSGGLKAAYDYRSFGEQIELTSPSTGKVTENFTGKEKDDETELDYFGARYLDPMLGMWTSVDPMRQRFSPYTYGNNNPIARIDPDGNADLRMAVFYNRDQNGKVLPPNLKQDVDRALSGALNPWYDTYEVKYFGENASAEEISNFINGGDFGAIAMHGEIDADGNFIAHDMDGNYIDAYDLKFNVKTLLGACHSEAFIRFEDETGNLVAPKYDENGMTKSFVESINFLINNSDTKNPYRIDIMGGIKD